MGALRAGGGALGSVVLIGFMGSGKTTLGRLLAQRLDWTFIDLDEALVRAHGCSIRQLVEREGEDGFRRHELEMLRAHVRTRPGNRVTATGGGIVETDAARPLLPQLGTVVWLRAAPEVCIARLGSASEARPLLDPQHDWRSRYARRESLYRDAARYVVETHPADEAACLAALERVARGESP